MHSKELCKIKARIDHFQCSDLDFESCQMIIVVFGRHDSVNIGCNFPYVIRVSAVIPTCSIEASIFTRLYQIHYSVGQDPFPTLSHGIFYSSSTISISPTPNRTNASLPPISLLFNCFRGSFDFRRAAYHSAWAEHTNIPRIYSLSKSPKPAKTSFNSCHSLCASNFTPCWQGTNEEED